MKYVNANFMYDFCIQMPLQLISMPGCDNKSWTISICLLSKAWIKGVEFNIGIQFQRWSKNKNIMKYLNVNLMNDLCIEIALQLISIPGCDNKSWTTSVWPFDEATSKGVLFNNWIQFQKWLKN